MADEVKTPCEEQLGSEHSQEMQRRIKQNFKMKQMSTGRAARELNLANKLTLRMFFAVHL